MTPDLSLLIRLRLAVGRFGEMDAAGWWNTREVLGLRGRAVYSRGFPRTHFFVQGRVVSEVAARRCKTLFDPPGCMTLWSLSPGTEQALERAAQSWMEDGGGWRPYFEALQRCDGGDLLGWLQGLGLIGPDLASEAGGLRRSADFRAVPLPGVHQETDETIRLLAAGFFRGERGKPAVPYARLDL